MIVKYFFLIYYAKVWFHKRATGNSETKKKKRKQFEYKQ